MVNFTATTAASAPELASRVMALLPREFQDAFVQQPDVFMFFSSIFLAAVLVAAFWMLTGMGKASTMARMALRGQALKRTKDHRALVLIAEIEGGGSLLRQEMKEAIEDNFGMFSFEQDVQVDLFPIKLKTVSPRAHPETRRRIAVEAGEALERSAADVIVWGKRNMLTGKIDLRITTLPGYGRTHEVQDFPLGWKVGRPDEAVQRALAFALARKARPVLHRPQDYKPERLQPIVEGLDKLVDLRPVEISENLNLDILSDFASGALSLGERGGHIKWLRKRSMRVSVISMRWIARPIRSPGARRSKRLAAR
jgi:hypothetical protein